MRRRPLFCPLICLLLVAACADAPVEISDEGATESRPADDAEAALKAGIVRCNPRSATGYTAGRPTPITVIEVDGKPVEVDTANAFAQMQEAARKEGVYLRVVSGFRSYEEQQYLYRCYVNCSCNSCNLAAPPGYSNHNSGVALDLNTHEPGVYRWLARNAARFGFERTVPSEDWHWEYLGRAPGEGPCPGGQPARSTAVRLAGFHDGGFLRNGVRLKVEAGAGTHHVRYFVDGYRVAASEDRQSGFAVQFTLSQLGKRTFVARAFDALDRELGEARATATVTEGDAHRPPLDFASLEEGGWYRNGVPLAVAPVPKATVVEYYAGAHLIGRSQDAEAGFPARYAFATLGYRTLTAVAYDLLGGELARGTVTVRVLPGAENGAAAVVLVSPEADQRHGRTVLVRAVTSDSVTRVAFSADGWALGEAAAEGGIASIEYTFNQAGRRVVKAVAYDAAGRAVASTESAVTLNP